MSEKISAIKLSSIQVIRTGREPFDMTLTISELQLSGNINGEAAEAIVDATQLYALMLFIDKLDLPKTTVIPGKPPRGQTKFVLTYQDGKSIVLGMNLNEPGVEYFELAPEQFMELMELWGNL